MYICLGVMVDDDGNIVVVDIGQYCSSPLMEN